MVKNTGIPENQLSNLDFGGVLKDSHNIPLHALDVNQVNSLVPSSFSKVSVVYTECGRPETITYYGLGLQEKFSIGIRSDAQGTYEITTISLVGQTPIGLDGKYFIIYDSSGSVGVWFNLDGVSTPPTTGAIRDIEIEIATGDTTTDLATKLSNKLDLDSKFTGTGLVSLSIIQSSTVGNKPNATQGDTTLGISIVDGIDSLRGKSFKISYSDNSDDYLFYYSVDGSYSPYTPTGSDYEIAILSSDTIDQIATKTSSIINNLTYLVSVSSRTDSLIDYLRAGAANGYTDVDTNQRSSTIQEGQDNEVVATIILTYDECMNVTGVERV